MHLVATSQAEQLAVHLRQQGWAGAGRSGMVVHVLAAPGCQTEGEALRFVEERDVVKGDFVLVSGAMVANADLRPAVQAHLARRGVQKQAIMTLLLHSRAAGSAGAAAALPSDGCLAVVDPRSQQLLRLEQCEQGGHANIGTHLLGERNCIAVRHAGRLRPPMLAVRHAGRLRPPMLAVSSWTMCKWATDRPHLPAGAQQPAPARDLCLRPRGAGAAERQL